MPYKPTGKPPGRPPKATSRPKPEPKPEERAEQAPPRALEASDRLRQAPFAICRTCWPEGWPQGTTGLGCAHGIWSRPWVI